MDESLTETESRLSIAQIKELLKEELKKPGEALPAGSIYDDVMVAPEPPSLRGMKQKNIANIDALLVNDSVTELPQPKNKTGRVTRKKAPHDRSLSTTQDLSKCDEAKSRPQRVIRREKMVHKENSVLGDSIIEIVPAVNLGHHRAARPKKMVDENFSVGENSLSVNETASELKTKVTKAYKPTRGKKVLGEIQNTFIADDDTVDTSVVKRKRNTKKTKAAMLEIENENIEIVAEEINNKFKQIEEFELLVE